MGRLVAAAALLSLVAVGCTEVPRTRAGDPPRRAWADTCKEFRLFDADSTGREWKALASSVASVNNDGVSAAGADLLQAVERESADGSWDMWDQVAVTEEILAVEVACSEAELGDDV